MKIKKYHLFRIIFFSTIPFCLNAQSELQRIHTVSFYNVENLFDTINDINKKDERSPIMEIENNRTKIYYQKLQNLSKVISDIGYKHTKLPPTIVGLSEVENRMVIEDLIETGNLKKSNYGISHFESPDKRGIDVAIIYLKKYFKIINENVHDLELYDTNSKSKFFTRYQHVIEGLLEGERIFLIINHWPSRIGGKVNSSTYRKKAAELNVEIIDSINFIHKNPKIINMGDFNDDPIDFSIKEILNGKENKYNLFNKDFFNAYEKLYLEGQGTLVYKDKWNLFDQILVSRSLIDESYKSFSFLNAFIYNEEYIINQLGRYKGYPFRSFASGSFLNGYSDHLPVYILLLKKL